MLSIVNHATDSAATSLDDAMIVRSLHCRGCQYDLRHLRVGGRCPECGLEIWETVLDAVDPAASRLPRLRDPDGVGNAMLWLMACLLAGTLLQLARPVAHVLDMLNLGIVRSFEAFAPPSLLWISGCVLLAGLWSMWKLAPPRGHEPGSPVWRDIWLIGGGLAGWALVVIVSYFRLMTQAPRGGPLEQRLVQTVVVLVGAAAVLTLMFGLRDVLRVIGERSREYRSARGGRQRIRDMIAATIAIGLGQLLRLIGILLEVAVLSTFGTIMIWISTLMLVIGLGYLVVNAWWIRRSLRQPPPTLRVLLDRSTASDAIGRSRSDTVG
jgi:hypothetical protein